SGIYLPSRFRCICRSPILTRVTIASFSATGIGWLRRLATSRTSLKSRGPTQSARKCPSEASTAWPSQPLLPLEAHDLADGDHRNEGKNTDITVRRVKLGHIPRQLSTFGVGRKVHAVDADDEGKRDEDGRDDSEHAHDLLGAEADG